MLNLENDPLERPNLPEPPIKPRRRWTRIAWNTLLVLLLTVLSLVTLALFFNESVSRMVIREMNKSLKYDMEVGDVGLSLLSGFPDAAVDLESVKIRDAFGGTLLQAKTISFRFQLFSLFGDEIHIRSVLLRDGRLEARVNSRGKANYDIVKPAPKTAAPESGSTLRIALENAELRNMVLLYDNAVTAQKTNLLVNKAYFSGNFSDEKFNLASQANIACDFIEMDGHRYLSQEALEYKALIAVDLSKDLYDFQAVDLTIGGNTFSLSGLVVSKKDFTDINLKLRSDEGDISVVFDLLPDAYHEYFNDFSSSGQYTCTGTIKGRMSKTLTPRMALEVRLRDGRVVSNKLQSPLRNVSFLAKFDAEPGSPGFFEISDFKGDFGGQPLALDIQLRNLDDPIVDFRCSGILPLAAAYGLFNNDDISNGEGFVRLDSLHVSGRYADMESMNSIANVSSSGRVVFNNARLVYKKTSVQVQSGELGIHNNGFSADSLMMRIGRSDILLDGHAANLLPVLFADSLNSTKAFLGFDAKINCKNLYIDELIDLFSVPEANASLGQAALDSLRSDNNEQHSRSADKLKGIFEADLNFVQYGKMVGTNFIGKLRFDRRYLSLNGETDAMMGHLDINGEAVMDNAPTLTMRFIAKGIDLRTLMEQSDNFGQEYVTDANLRGRLDGRMVMYCFWDENGEFNWDRLKAYVDLNARNGELIGMKMLEDFSTFVHIEDLRRVKFTQLQNFLEISNQRLYLPYMFIQSNALNLGLSGMQAFNYDLDYKIKINAGQTILGRIKKHDPDLEALPAEKGLFNIYYTIVGNVDKYDIKRGKKAVKTEFERSEERKKSIARELDKAFGPGTQTLPMQQPEEEFLDPITGPK